MDDIINKHDKPETHDNRTETRACDCISREAAIDDLHGKDPSQIWDTADIEVWVNALPSAQPEQECEKCIFKPFKQFQPERKKGKWINEGVYGEGHAQCSIRCNNPLCNFHYIGYLGDYNFCPNCGADMREVE